MNAITRAALFVLMLFALLSAKTQDEFEQWLKKDQQDFQRFLAEEDKAFLNFLKADWEAFKLSQGIKSDEKPKPVRIPTAPVPPKPKEPVKPKPEEKPIKTIETPPPPKLPEPKKPEPPINVVREKPQVSFVFFNRTLSANYDDSIDLRLDNSLSNNVIANAWETLAKSDFAPTATQLRQLADQMQLNDWGRLLLVNSYSSKVEPQSANKQIIINWFYLNKLGFEVKIAYQENRLFLLLPTKQMMYETPYTTIDGQKYFFIGFRNQFKAGSGLYTYHGAYVSSQQCVSLALPVMPKILKKDERKQLRFAYNNRDFVFDVHYTRDAVNFMADYPQTDLGVYVQSSPSPELLQSLVSSLSPYIAGKSEVEAVNFLLRFVQTAFQYQTDDQQFGREKFLLPEETIFYPSSDCEDRSILFALLVDRLTGLKIVMLDYPGHVCTAIKFTDEISGDSILFSGRRFVICDPTYINATAGMCMDTYKSVNPSVIEYSH